MQTLQLLHLLHLQSPAIMLNLQFPHVLLLLHHPFQRPLHQMIVLHMQQAQKVGHTILHLL